MSDLKEALEKGQDVEVLIDSSPDLSGLDDIAFDDDFSKGGTVLDVLEEKPSSIDSDDLYRAVCLENAALATLLAGANRLLDTCGDLKIARSITLALNHLSDGDKVLLFSRYTDTIDALVRLFEEADSGRHPFGVYTGQKSVKVSGGEEIELSKSQIKASLESGDIPLVFCSDAASEGLNLQAARILINVDVPWTPARLEQRIGRVARLGQKADEVVVYNVWYPNSVEAKMYSRIQSRLDETNLAIGEFPEVVADTILDSIVSGGSDDGVYELQEIRNSVQMRALSRLWSSKDSRKTTSRYVRDSLIEICDDNLIVSEVRGDTRVYSLPNGGHVALCAEEGRPESVSLSSDSWSFVDFDLAGFVVVEDREGNPASFAREDDPSCVICHECLPDLLSGKPIGVESIDGSWPKMLPDNDKLDLSFSVDCECPTAPVFWPPKL